MNNGTNSNLNMIQHSPHTCVGYDTKFSAWLEKYMADMYVTETVTYFCGGMRLRGRANTSCADVEAMRYNHKDKGKEDAWVG